MNSADTNSAGGQESDALPSDDSIENALVALSELRGYDWCQAEKGLNSIPMVAEAIKTRLEQMPTETVGTLISEVNEIILGVIQKNFTCWEWPLEEHERIGLEFVSKLRGVFDQLKGIKTSE
ncbi:MAG: hypothetical protein CMN79_05310 [Spirochaetales bacterium]|mgnify:FL=1|jgi:hypothetical protein|nr:hypothetical protein [Spirochaetales bacterium]MDP7453914.1 hypothetical protein [Candidatus Peribacteraceae bacterium]|tara:strand:- start:69 stop:434 length:366 start_codon:yes stop_codon:yes gene_type:complete